MMRRWQHTSLCCAVVLAGCATVDNQIEEHEWLRKTRDQSVKTAGVVMDATSKPAKRVQDYLARKDVHGEAAVLDALRKTGVGTAKAVAPPNTEATTTSTPVKPGTLSPSKKTPAAQQPSTVSAKAHNDETPLNPRTELFHPKLANLLDGFDDEEEILLAAQPTQVELQSDASLPSV